jgi:hypothetical protein
LEPNIESEFVLFRIHSQSALEVSYFARTFNVSTQCTDFTTRIHPFCSFLTSLEQLLSAAHQMSHSPSSTDFRIGIEAAVHMRDSSSAFAFLQRIQHQHQQRQLSENSLDCSVDSSMNLDSGAFYSVMSCASQMSDASIVQRTFDELKATVGVSGLEPRAWVMLLQVRTQ